MWWCWHPWVKAAPLGKVGAMGVRVLIVDDQPAFRAAAREVIASTHGFDTAKSWIHRLFLLPIDPHEYTVALN